MTALCLMPEVDGHPRLLGHTVLWMRQTLINYQPNMLEAGKKAIVLHDNVRLRAGGEGDDRG